MTLKTVQVNIALTEADGTPAAGASVAATLIYASTGQPAYDTDGGIVVPPAVAGVTDAGGLCSLDLWPNERGTRGTAYRVQARRGYERLLDTVASVPDVDAPVDLDAIINTAPYPPIDAAQQAVADAQAAAFDANASATATAADAQATAADRIQTGLDRTAAAESAALAEQAAGDIAAVEWAGDQLVIGDVTSPHLTGPGVPAGGSAGQVLTKISATDYATGWVDPPSDAPLAPYDFWTESRFPHTANPNGPFVGTAVSGGGTANGAAVTTRQDGYFQNGVLLHKSTTANGGYRWSGSSHGAIRFGTVALEFWAAWRPVLLSGTTVRIGFHDASSVTAPVDGPYIEIIDGVVTGRTATNSVYQATPTSYTLAVDAVYLFRVHISADASVSTFAVYNGLTGALLWSGTLSGGIGTTTVRSGGAGIVATEAGVVAVDIGILYWMGFGTPAGYQRARG